MIFRESPNGQRLMLIRTTYSAEKKRGVQKTIDTLAADGSEEASPELLAQLTTEERDALSAELQKRRETHGQHEQVQRIRLMPASLEVCADAVESACSGNKKQYAEKISSASGADAENWAAECWQQLARIERSMRKLGFPRNKFAPKPEAAQE